VIHLVTFLDLFHFGDSCISLQANLETTVSKLIFSEMNRKDIISCDISLVLMEKYWRRPIYFHCSPFQEMHPLEYLLLCTGVFNSSDLGCHSETILIF
jgi:hypothetical protein